MEHIVYTDKHKDELENIVSGKQTMIIRSNQSRRVPHSRVFKGETLYFTKKGSNEIKYTAEVKEVYNYNKVLNSQIDDIILKNKEQLMLEDNELDKYKKKCICIIEFENVKAVDKINIYPQASLVDWIILNDINDITQK